MVSSKISNYLRKPLFLGNYDSDEFKQIFRKPVSPIQNPFTLHISMDSGLDLINHTGKT